MNLKKDLKIYSTINNIIENDTTWWGDFIREVVQDDNYRDVIINILLAEENTTEETVASAKEAIEGMREIPDIKINPLERRLAILEKRIERRTPDDFGSMLKYYRDLKKISLAELGEMINTSPSYISRIETGERKAPSYPIMEKLANALDVSVMDLLRVADYSKREEKGPQALATMLFNNDVYILNKNVKIGKKEKQALIDLIEFIYECSWKDEKHKEALVIADKIDKLKKIQKTK